jgi:hypothetical protein
MKLQDLHEAAPRRRLFTSKASIEKWLKAESITKFVIHDDFTVDVLESNQDGVQITNSKLPYLPVIFNQVDDSFVLGSTFRSLKGCPKIVKNSVCIYANLIPNLEGAPQTVGDDFSLLQASEIKNFKGGPRTVGGDFYVSGANNLTSWAGLPDEIHNNFYCPLIKPIPVLDVFRVKHLTSITGGGAPGRIKKEWSKVLAILNKFIKQPYGNKRIIDCQSELIDAGLENWAQFGDEE